MARSSACRKYTGEQRKEKLRLLRAVTNHSATCKQTGRFFATLIPPYARWTDRFMYATTSSFAECRQMEQFRRWPMVKTPLWQKVAKTVSCAQWAWLPMPQG